MILLVADDAPAAVETALPEDTVEHVTTAAAAREPSDHPDFVLIDYDAIEGADQLISWLRSDESWDPRVPLIVLRTTSIQPALPLRPYDAVVDPDDDQAVADAIEIARAVAGYRGAIDELYERCLDRAEGGAGPLDIDPDVMDARRRADECLNALPDDPEILAALLADPRKADSR